ncbi:hypothetical protein K458DRAFT_345610 [Lentithecium fluviatile CBS 122367]|uniref:Wings apart-like protein C-terminal domain-containing protein n=1 Tax=Lentithecium fluviatile CBS 122367 TaxID=1168545 RepID=A0A6G1IQA0_9PLEO|nr:hypothetical protein K458DRAFT_345610 [Lentithecium fluviatile CBS 122367]
MAMPMSSAFTMPDRRKKVITYGRSARYTAPQKLQDDAPSPERPRKQSNITYGTAQRPGAILGTGSTFNSAHATHQKSPALPDVFDVPSDDEPTPRPSAAPKKKAAPNKEVVDEFDFPGSEDERPQTSHRIGKITRPLRKAGQAQPLGYTSKKNVQERERAAVPSSDDPIAAPLPPARRRAKTPQTLQKPASTGHPQTTTRSVVRPNVRSRATTPAASTVVAKKVSKGTTKLPAKKVVVEAAVSWSPDLDVFDVPSSDEDAPARTPMKPRPAPISRNKMPSTAPVSHAPPSPAPSFDSDVSNASNKRKRRASASSSATAKPAQPPEQKSDASVPWRGRKYQKKEDSISPGHDANSLPQTTMPIAKKPEDHAKPAPKRTRVLTNPTSAKPRIVKGQSSPATLHSMLAMRSLAKPSPVPEAPEVPAVDDETMYDIPEVTTPLARAAKPSLPGSVTPRQQALFSNLLGDSSDSTTSMPSISRLRLTERTPGSAIAALNKSSSDIPQSAHTRKGRLIDMLKQAAPSSDEDSESDEETEENMTEIPVISAPSQPAADNKPASQAASNEMEVDSEAVNNSQSSQAVLHLNSGARITYAQQRSILQETNFEDELMNSMDIDDDLGLGFAHREISVSESGDDAAQVRGIHELRRQGQQYRFQSEASASIEDISGKGGLNASQRRSALIEFATDMAEKSYIGQLLESSLTALLLRSIAPTGEIVFDFAAAVTVLFILETRPGYAVLDQIYQASTLETLKILLTSSFSGYDISRIAKDRKTNMSMSAREMMAEFRILILNTIWPAEKPEKVTPQLLAMKVLERLVIGLRKTGVSEAIVDGGIVAKLLDATSSPIQHLKAGKATAQDRLILATTFSILESLSVSHDKQATWSNGILSRLADITPVFFEGNSASPIRLVIRLCMNLTNNKPKACQLFAWPSFVLPLLRSISQKFKLLATELEEERRTEVLEDLILSLGAMINLAEYSDQARASVVRDGEGLIGDLVEIFLEGSARAEHADSMEESQSSVTIGYLTVLLGNLCLNNTVRAVVCVRLPGKKIDVLVQKVREFVMYNQRVDRLTGQFEGEEGVETLRNFTARLMRVVEGLETAGE